jgi:hypothetical protein
MTLQQLQNRFLAGVLAMAITALPIDGRAQELTHIEAQDIAREAYIYGFPIVENYSMMFELSSATDSSLEALFNKLKHRDPVISPADAEVVTPNIETPYSFACIDLRAEPVVLIVPEIEAGRYYSIQLIDFYNYTFDYIGTRATGNAAGRYMLVGPKWVGETPANIDKVIHCDTELAMAIYRTQLRGGEDLENFERIRSLYTIQTLSQVLGQPSPEPSTKVTFPPPYSEVTPNPSFFSTLNFLLQFCPADTSGQELMAQLARIGVIAKQPYDASQLSPEMLAAVQTGIAEGEAAISAAALTMRVPDVVGTRDDLGNDYLKRAVAAKLGRFANSKEEAVYPLYLSDAVGNPLDGADTEYQLKFSTTDLPPVNAFWSITMYDAQTSRLVPNPISRYQITSLMIPTLSRDADGGLTLYIQRESPEETQATNWLPAPAGPFYMVMRLYWPKPEVYNGGWTPPLVWPDDAAPRPSIIKPAGAESADEVKPSVLVDEPKPELERPTVWGEPTEVQIAIYVIDVDEVDSADQSFAASVYFDARWKNPFLRHKGPGPMLRGLTDVWNPRLTIIGQQAAWKSYPEAVEIEPDGTVICRQKIWGRFSQPLKLQDFPFDQQELSVQIVAAGLLEEHIKMVPLVNEAGNSSGIAPKFSLPDFDVLDWNASSAPYYPVPGRAGVAGYELKISIDRQPTYYILKVIIPLCLIVVMSWLPRWINPDETGTNIGISTSAFLTLVAYLFAVTVLLPRVSYITRLDRFILLSTLTVFAGLIQTVANTFLIQKGRTMLAERLDRGSRIVYPLLLAIVLLVSFAL